MNSTTFKFTATRLNQCTCPPNKDYVIYWDETVKGLVLKTYLSLKKTFLFQTRLGGKVLKISIGPFPAYTSDKYRLKVKEFDVMCSNGVDPSLENKKQIALNELEIKHHRRRKFLFRDIWSAYLTANQSRW